MILINARVIQWRIGIRILRNRRTDCSLLRFITTFLSFSCILLLLFFFILSNVLIILDLLIWWLIIVSRICTHILSYFIWFGLFCILSLGRWSNYFIINLFRITLFSLLLVILRILLSCESFRYCRLTSNLTIFLCLWLAASIKGR